MPGPRRKVLFIATAYPRFDGDVITPWLGETIARLREVDVDVSVLAPAFEGGPDQQVDGVAVHRFRYAPARWETLSHDHPIIWQLTERPIRFGLVPGYIASSVVAATRLARSGAFDVIHAFWPLPHALPAMVARRVTGIPLVSTFFGAELHWLASHNALTRAVARAIVRQSDAVTAISAFTARELRQIVPSADPTIIPFGAAVAPRALASGREPFASSPARFLFVGRLLVRKGVDVLLDALARLGPEATLTVVGEGAERERLEAHARACGVTHRVVFAGRLPPEGLERALDDCDALVLPAIMDPVAGTEGLGVVLIEAMSLGKPVIASDIGGIPDIVIHERNGLLVPPADPAALSVAMQRLMEAPTLARTLGAEGQRHVETDFAWPRIVSALTALYDDVTSRRAR